MVSRSSPRGSGITSPRTRSRATPPSGKMDSRTWVKRRASATGKVLCASPRSGDRGTSSAQSAAGSPSSVVAGFPPPPGLPAVHDLTAVPVPARLEGRGGRRQQVLLLAERLVAGGDDAAAQPARGEIGLRRHLAAPPAGPSPAAAGRRPSAVDSGQAMI